MAFRGNAWVNHRLGPTEVVLCKRATTYLLLTQRTDSPRCSLALEKTIRLQMLRNHLRFFSRCLLVRACE